MAKRISKCERSVSCCCCRRSKHWMSSYFGDIVCGFIVFVYGYISDFFCFVSLTAKTVIQISIVKPVFKRDNFFYILYTTSSMQKWPTLLICLEKIYFIMRLFVCVGRLTQPTEVLEGQYEYICAFDTFALV